MQINQAHTAILVFTRSAVLEAQVKPLAYRRKHAHKVADLLNQRIISIAQQSGIAVFIGDESIQEGNSFASRFHSAFEHVFDLGYEQVIAVGNDCLDLKVEHLQHAQDLLEQNETVIGPAEDGGLYLFGLHRSAFEQLDFKALPWQSAALFSTLKDHLIHYQLDLALLEGAMDIDTPEHLIGLLRKQTNWNRFFRQIANLLFETASTLFQNLAHQIEDYRSAFFSRGPPSLWHAS